MRRAALLIVAACACTSARKELEWSPSEPGQHRVGYRERTITYTPAGTSEPRSLRLAIWHPTAATDGPVAKYMGDVERPGVIASPPPIEGPLPVMVFSHGNLSFAEQSYFLTEHLASHGFLVLAPDHTGNTVSNLGGVRPPEMFFLRPLDLSAVLDWAYGLAEPDALAGLAGEQVAVSGHSYGGYTSFALSGAAYAMDPCGSFCESQPEANRARFAAGLGDPRIEATIALAAGNSSAFGPAGVARIATPVLMITGSEDHMVKNATEGDPYWAALDGAADRRVDLVKAGHHSFDITCDLFPALGMDEGCGPDALPWMRAHEIIRTLTLAFARRHLDEDTAMDAILDGPADGAVFSSRATSPP